MIYAVELLWCPAFRVSKVTLEAQSYSHVQVWKIDMLEDKECKFRTHMSKFRPILFSLTSWNLKVIFAIVFRHPILKPEKEKIELWKGWVVRAENTHYTNMGFRASVCLGWKTPKLRRINKTTLNLKHLFCSNVCELCFLKPLLGGPLIL